MNQNRLRSPVVWAAIVAQALSILLALDVIDTGMSEAVQQLAAGILQLLTLFGVLNNPTERNGF